MPITSHKPMKWRRVVITGRRRDHSLLPSLRQPLIRRECSAREELVVIAIEAFTQPTLQQNALARIAIQLGESDRSASWPLTTLLTTTHPGGYEPKIPAGSHPPDFDLEKVLHVRPGGVLLVNVIHDTEEQLPFQEPVELSIVLQLYGRGD